MMPAFSAGNGLINSRLVAGRSRDVEACWCWREKLDIQESRASVPTVSVRSEKLTDSRHGLLELLISVVLDLGGRISFLQARLAGNTFGKKAV